MSCVYWLNHCTFHSLQWSDENFNIHCDESDECDEIVKERKMIILIVFKHELNHNILYILQILAIKKQH